MKIAHSARFSSILEQNFTYKVADLEVRRFESYLGLQKFPKFLSFLKKNSKRIYNVSHSFLSLFKVKRLFIVLKVRFQPIVLRRLVVLDIDLDITLHK